MSPNGLFGNKVVGFAGVDLQIEEFLPITLVVVDELPVAFAHGAAGGHAGIVMGVMPVKRLAGEPGFGIAQQGEQALTVVPWRGRLSKRISQRGEEIL